MQLTVNQAILHILDTNITEPILSDSVLYLDEVSSGYIKEHISNCFESDSASQCTFLEDSSFFAVIEDGGGDFVKFSHLVAMRFFEFMTKNPAIPPADLLVADVNIDGQPYAGVFKMNYKTSYIHYCNSGDGINNNSIIKQRTVLPSSGGRIDEFFFINMDTMALQVAEKKYEINGAKDFYISSSILECHQKKPEKAKLGEVKKIVEKSIKAHYVDDKTADAQISAIVCEEVNENVLQVERLKERVAAVYPLAKETFSAQLEEKHMAEERIYVAPSSAKKLEKQSIRTKNGVVINVPTYLMNDGKVEFINNPDGSVSILIKNVYM